MSTDGNGKRSGVSGWLRGAVLALLGCCCAGLPAGRALAAAPVDVPREWLERYNLPAAESPAANGMEAWECFVAGLDPTNAAARFTVRIGSGAGGDGPFLSWVPDLATGRVYTVEAKANLSDSGWVPLTNGPPRSLSDAEKAGLRFFRVKVGMPEGWPPSEAEVYSVTVDAGGGAGASGAGRYPAGAPVTVDAGVKEGHSFLGWFLSNVSADPFANPVSFIMPENDVTLKAVWSVNSYGVAVVDGGEGASGAGNYQYGMYVTVTAGPKTGHTFNEWTAEGVELADPSWTSVSFPMPGNDVTLTAGWTPNDYTLTLSDCGKGASGAGAHPYGSAVAVSAGTKTGHSFAGWTAEGVDLGAAFTNADVTFAMPANDVSLTASWTVNSYSVILGNGGEGASGAGEYAYGASVTADAGAKPGYAFAGWAAEGVALADTNAASVTFPMPANGVSLTAAWKACRYMVIDVSGGASATNYPVEYLADVPAGGWTDAHRTTNIVLRKIDPGTFLMGSPANELGRQNNEVLHQVTLTEPFYIGVFQLTQKQWELVMGNKPSKYPGDCRPVEQVTYNAIRGTVAGAGWPAAAGADAASFIGKIRARTGLALDLPTEAQWEYACRAGTTNALNTGKNLTNTGKSPEMDEAGRYTSNRSDGKGGGDPHTAVGYYPPNAWGLYDMHGNVCEWCRDWYGAYPSGTATNPVGPASGSCRVMRGGSWYFAGYYCRSAHRLGSYAPTYLYSDVGFRLGGAAGPAHSLSIASEYGAPAPAVGEGWFPEGEIRASVSPREIVQGGTRRVCEGWTGGGGVPASGTNTSVAFTLDRDSALTWKWRTDYQISVSVFGPGSASVTSQWVAAGETLEVRLAKDDPDASIRLDGDTEGVTLDGLTLRIPADRARSIVSVIFGEPDPERYLVIDVSGGASATNYPVSYLADIPAGGWTDAHRTTNIVLRKIDPGTFIMGSPANEPGRGSDETQHEVTLTKPFYIGVFELTQKQWELVMGSKPAYYKGDFRPVEKVSYNDIRGTVEGARWPALAGADAGSFIGKIRARTGLALDLPTEAQWEYACRAGTAGLYNVDGRSLSELGRYDGNKSDGKGGYAQHTAVGSYLPNAWGLYDMHGNVWEWCLDWYVGNLGTGAVTNPAGPASGSDRVNLCGSWNYASDRCRSADRDCNTPDYRVNYMGFRLSGAAVPAHSLSVVSEYGAPAPAACEGWFPEGEIRASVSPREIVQGGTRRVCEGWTIGGGVPASGTNTSVAFTLDQDSALTWKWRTDYQISVSVSGPGSASVTSQWVAAGETLEVQLTKDDPNASIRIDGDSEGVVLEGLTLRIPADRLRSIVSVIFGEPDPGRYLVIDVSGGASATNYPVSYLADIPAGGWTDAHRTTNIVLRKIDPGTFTMGSPANELGRKSDEIQHEVTLTDPFYIGVFELTQKQWELVMGSNPSSCKGDFRPVEQVSYNDIRGSAAGAGWPAAAGADAGSFIGKIRARTGLALDLPTDAQWEYACRAGTATALNSGKNLTNTGQSPEMNEAGRYASNKTDGKGGYAEHTAAGSYPPNAWGLYDMHANVWEWCLDWYGGYSSAAATNSAGPASGSYRVICGGSWRDSGDGCRSANRYSSFSSTSRGDNVGFRLSGTARPVHSLSVASEFGAPAPAVCEGWFPEGEIRASVKSPVETVAGGTRGVCEGWTGTGGVPASGTNTSVAFTLDQDSALTWNWRTEHWVFLAISGPGSASVTSQWVTAGETLEVQLTQDNPNASIRIDGDTEGVVLDGLTLRIPAGRPRLIVSVIFEAPDPERYLVIDVSGGASATNYPVSYLADIPAGGWTDAHRTTNIVLRKIDPGTFMMGSPANELGRYDDEIQHEVTLTKPFYIGVFELTQKQWELVMGGNPSSYKGDARPVEQVSYNDIRGTAEGAKWPVSSGVDAASFMGVIRAKTGVDSFDLPMEAQWEYACRAGTTTALNTGGDASGISEAGRYGGNKSDGKGGYTQYTAHTAVGSYLPNAWGLYDMHGNVWEWCLDWEGGYPSGAVTDPTGPASGEWRVDRGGGWRFAGHGYRSASRDCTYPYNRYDFIGFRPVCSAGQ